MEDVYCNGTIPSNTDVGGLGIILSFGITALLTILTACIPAAAVLQADLSKHFPNLLKTFHHPIPRYIIQASDKFLDALRDLQLMTSLAVMVAGFATLQISTYYHQEIVVNLWWLTLNSFWVSRIELDPLDLPEDEVRPRQIKYDDLSIRSVLRMLAVLSSVTLGCVYQSYTIIDQDRNWDWEDGNNCYIWHDNSPEIVSWLWVAGAALYAITLGMVIVPWTRKFVQSWLEILQDRQDSLNRSFVKAGKQVIAPLDRGLSIALVLERVLMVCWFVAISLFTVVFWSARQLLAIVSFGDGWYPILLAAFTSFAIWTVWDIVDLVTSNAHLVEAEESVWGFGQVLPMMLLAAPMLQAIDAIYDAIKEARR